MANTVGPANDWQQWISKWMPELQANNTSNSAASPLDSQEAGSTAGLISKGEVAEFSTKAEKLQFISKTYFSNGAISSSQIKDLSLSLYQQGLLSSEEFRQVTGEPLPQAGMITDSIQFLSSFIQSESIDGDTEGALELNQVLHVLQKADEKPTPASVADEVSSAHYVRAYRDLLIETESDETLIKGFDDLVSVFEALQDIRQQGEGAKGEE